VALNKPVLTIMQQRVSRFISVGDKLASL